MTTIAQTATLAHGYTMAHIENMARYVVNRRPSTLLDVEESIAVARCGIVEALYAPDRVPTHHELLDAGARAFGNEVARSRSMYGVAKEGPGAPRFRQYWLPVQYERTDGFSDRLVEKMALRDVLGVLTDLQYEAVATLAAFDNRGPEAAAALGVTYNTFMQRLHAARKAIKQVWFGDETPPARKVGQSCKSGHPRAEHGRQRADGAWECGQCSRLAARRASRRRRDLARVADVEALVS